MAPKLMPDEVVARSEEFHGFIARVCRVGTSYMVTIPPSVVRGLGLKHRDLVEVALRGVDEEFALREYGYAPPRSSGPKQPRLVCPVCGKPGALGRTRSKLFISHCKCDGFDEKVRHYISKEEHSDFYAKFGGKPRG